MRINNIQNQNFTSLSALSKPLGLFFDANNPIPTLFIETGVTAGRSFEANKTGGKIEATERFIEQGTSAIIWLWGVQALKKLGDKIGSKVLKLGNLDFDIGFDYLRNPLENIDKKLIAFKTGNILLSTALATAFIGFGLPKINHFITNKMLSRRKKNESALKPKGVEEYKKSLGNKNNIHFTSLLDTGKNLAHLLENNSTARLLITDMGVVGGRFYNARNKYEKIENLFRDISSIYFYLFSTKHIVKGLNKLTGNTNIDPKVLKATYEMLSDKAKNSDIDAKNFKLAAFGEISKENSQKIEELFKNRKIIDLDEFLSVFCENKEKALEMSKLQPILKNKSVLSKQQAKSVLSSGYINNPEFMHKVYDAATKGKYDKKNKFVSAKFLYKTRASVEGFIKQLDKKLQKQGGNLTEDLIKKTANSNIIKNFAFYSIGTIISTFTLAILIPKVQYFIRKKLTNDTEFVGIKDFKDKKV